MFSNYFTLHRGDIAAILDLLLAQASIFLKISLHLYYEILNHKTIVLSIRILNVYYYLILSLKNLYWSLGNYKNC